MMIWGKEQNLKRVMYLRRWGRARSRATSFSDTGYREVWRRIKR